MAVNLTKGQKVSLTKGNPGLKKITVGLGWDVNRYDGGFDFDLDASAFMLGANGRVPSDGKFIFVTVGGQVLSVHALTATTWLVCAVLAFLVIPIDVIRKAVMGKK